MNEARFRFYEELNDFLPPARRRREFAYAFRGAPAVKDAVEALGVPHVEVDLILADGRSVDFSHVLRDGQRIAVYPVFESLDIAPVTRLRERPLREPCFVCDVHLGKLARRLRILGFDTLYEDDLDDAAIAAVAARGTRCVLTRDIGLLKRNEVSRGYWLRATEVRAQVAEVVERLDLSGRIEPFKRCAACNALVEPVDKTEIAHLLDPLTQEHFEEFHQCPNCRKIYWKGTHYEALRAEIQSLIP